MVSRAKRILTKFPALLRMVRVAPSSDKPMQQWLQIVARFSCLPPAPSQMLAGLRVVQKVDPPGHQLLCVCRLHPFLTATSF